MSRGKRYDTEPKLNMTKVFAVAIAIAVIIMFVFIIKGIFTKDNTSGKITSKSYFTSYKDNKWGVIDAEGNNVIDPSYKEMIVIPNSKIPVFICTYDVNYETGEYSTKALNEKGEKIFTQYSKVEAIQNKDKNDNLWYDQDILKVQTDGKYGLIKISGEEILPTEYEEITSISGIENSYKIVKDDNGKYGIIDYSNNQVLEIKYDGIEKIYGNDLYVVTVEGKQKLVNKENADVLTKGFDSIKQILENQENAVIFVKSNKYGVMNLSGEVLIDAEYDDLKETKTGTFIAKKDDKYGIIDIEKQEKTPFEYNSISYNKKADIYVTEDSNFNSNILNSNLETKLTGILIELNETKGYLKLRINDEYKYYNFKFEEKQESDIFPNRTLFLSKKDGKYGFVDKTGKVVVDYIYDDATEQNDYGYAGIKKDGKWGSIDIKGNVVQEPTYNLDEYLLINFVGRWHLGLDINMNYYNQL